MPHGTHPRVYTGIASFDFLFIHEKTKIIMKLNKCIISLAAGVHLFADAAVIKKIPTEFDLRNISGVNMLPPVRDQKDEAACVIFSLVAAAETTIKMSNSSKPFEDFSEAATYFCDLGRIITGPDGKNVGITFAWGEQLDESVKFVSDKGFYYEKDFPFRTVLDKERGHVFDWHNNHCRSLKDKKRAAHKFKPQMFTNSSHSEIKRWITTVGPVVANFTVQPNFPYPNATIKIPGVYKSKPNQTEKFLTAHAVAVVGWSDNLNAWLVRNSYGPKWNGDGYIWMAYDQITIHGGLQLMKIN